MKSIHKAAGFNIGYEFQKQTELCSAVSDRNNPVLFDEMVDFRKELSIDEKLAVTAVRSVLNERVRLAKLNTGRRRPAAWKIVD